MKNEPLSQSSLAFLTINLLAALMLHIDRLPMWISIMAIGSLFWRFLIFRGRIRSPHWSLKGALVLLGFTGIYLTYGRSFSIESMTSLLVAGFILKPLEVQSRQESFVLIFLCYLLISLYFLFDQSPLGYLWVMVVLIFTLSTQITVNQVVVSAEDNDSLKGRSHGVIWQAILIFIKSLPLALFLFFVLPRLGPLWSMNISTQAGTIGLSDSMSPGDIAELGKSDELAFRVQFLDKEPDVKQLYWRALVLDYFDGEQWRQRYKPDIDWSTSHNLLKGDDEKISYEIMLEPHDQDWLFSLGVAEPITANIGISEDARLVSRDKIRSPMLYRAKSILNGHSQNQVLSKMARDAYLQVPRNDNERSQKFALELKEKFERPMLITKALRDYFGNKEFYYTLSPGTLNSDSTIDEFLFESQKGFCAHFAGSVVYLLRAAGIPARVVLGYQGAEENPVAGFYSVYQYNAHAWVELWVKNRGWVSIDPTGWVSPERIEQGVESALKNEFTGFSSGSTWLNGVRSQLNAFNYYWNDWMLNYKGDAQQGLISSLLGDRDQYEAIAIYLTGFFGLIALVFLSLLFDFKPERLSYPQKIIKQYRSMLEGWGLKVDSAMTVSQLSGLAMKINPMLEEDIKAIKIRLENSLYVSLEGGMLKPEYRELMARVKLLAKKMNKNPN